MTWHYQGILVESLPEDCVGYVYCITNLLTGRRYIGKKLAQFAKTSIKTVTLKNGTKKKKKIRSKVESDWKSYFGSSLELNADILALGKEHFTREILFYCQSKAECSYREAEAQFKYEVLRFPALWYNGIISVKIHRNHIKF